MSEVLLSIVIPTKNRYETLCPLLIALSSLIKDDIEIVVQDNSDNNKDFLDFLNQRRLPINYNYCAEWLSVGDNCDRAIMNASGKYITFIGDDDSVAPQICDVARILDKYNVDSCSCNYTLYRWPSATINGKKSFEYKVKNKIFDKPKLNELRKKIMRAGIQHKNGMPGVYHGMVKKDVLNQVYNKTGSYFPGPSPDMANSFALSYFAKNHINISIPYVIDGYSKASTGHLTEAKKHVGKLEEQSFLPKDTVEKWSVDLPRIWLPNTIWPQSAIQALKRCGNEEDLKYINFDAIYIKIAVMYPELKSEIVDLSKKYSLIHHCRSCISVGTKFLCNKIKGKFSRRCFANEVVTIENAMIYTGKLIEENNMIIELEEYLKKESFEV